MARRAKARLWIWGLFPLLIAGLLVVYGTKELIEKDLETRSTQALRAAGIDWAKPNFIGLDGTILGLAPSEEERSKAVKVVENVWGVRVVTDKLSLSPLITPFSWNALHGKGKISLDGYVTSDKVRQSILGLARAKFPNAKLSDRMKLARGVEDENAWFGQVSYGLSQLARLQQGEVKLVGDALSLTGSSLDRSAFVQLNKSFANGLPLNLKKGSILIQPPLVEDYYFSARYDAKTLLLEGVVPNQDYLNRVLENSGRFFANINVQNKLLLGSGAPQGWNDAVLLSLEELAKLNVGSAQLRGRNVKFEGQANSEDIALAVRKRIRVAFPKGFRIEDNVTVKKPDILFISPYELSVIDQGSEVIVTGYIESDASRGTILSAVQDVFPGRKVVDQLQLGRGAAPYFQESIILALGSMKGVKKGRLEFKGRDLTLSGETQDKTLFEKLSLKPVGLADEVNWSSRVQYDDRAEKAEKARLALEKKKAELEKQKAEKEKQARLDREAEKAKAELKKKAEEAERARKLASEGSNEKVTSADELAKKRQWLTPEETSQRLNDLYKESGAVSAKECQLLMNSIVRGSAIRFGVNSSVIRPSSFDILSKVHSVATRCTNTVIRIEGHTDSDGSEAYNLELSKRRARAVIAYLADKGIPQNRLDAKGFGERKPVATNGNSEGKSLNRRIEFVVFEN